MFVVRASLVGPELKFDAGCTNAQADEQLFVSLSTVTTHLAHICRKLDVGNRAALVTARAAQAPGVIG